VHQAPEDTARRGAKSQRHNATVEVQNFEHLHFCLLLETVTKNKPLLAAISSFLTRSITFPPVSHILRHSCQ
jgi:hypothetical protein